MMKAHTLLKTHTRKKRVGRGGNRGKTSGRGHKGQKSRAGGKTRPFFRDIVKRISKLRGHGKNRARTVRRRRIPQITVTLDTLNKINSDVISPKTLFQDGYIDLKKGRTKRIKIIGTGEVKKQFTVVDCELSKTAREKIENAGGKILI